MSASGNTGASTTGQGNHTLFISVPEDKVQAVLAAARVINEDEDVSGYLGAPLAEQGPSGSNCKISGFIRPNDFDCADSD